MKKSTTTIILVVVIIIFLFLFMGYTLKENFYYKTPYPMQCPSMGANLTARNPTAPYVRPNDQVQLQPGRCSAGAEKPFMAHVYNRDILPPTEENRVSLTGVVKPPIQAVQPGDTVGPQSPGFQSTDTLGDDKVYYQSGYGDIVIKDYAAMYPNINPRSSENLYGN